MTVGAFRSVVAGLTAVGDEVQCAVVGQGVGDELPGGGVELDPVGAQFGGPRYPRDQRHRDDAPR